MSKKKKRPTPVPAEAIPHLIDAHTHLASAGASTPADIDALVERAVAAGVEKICTVGDGVEEAQAALDAARHHPRVYAACAIHPTRADELNSQIKERLEAMAADPRCVAIGETGVDTYWLQHDPDNTAPLEQQEESLRWHADLAARHGKALMIHNREGDEHLFRILDDCDVSSGVILHCFSSSVETAREAVERGWVLSFAGNVTFKRNDYLRDAASLVPSDNILIETDAPYMTPEPFRGARNEPALIGHTALCVAEARGVDVRDLAAQLSANFDRVYGLST